MSRIYKSSGAKVSYQGSARGQGFAPVQASSDVKAAQEYGAALVQDAQTMGREILQNLQLEQNAEVLQMSVDQRKLAAEGQLSQSMLQGQQNIDKMLLSDSQQLDQLGLRYSQAVDRGQLALTQKREGFLLANNQLLDKQELATQQMDQSHMLKREQNEFRADMNTKVAQFQADVTKANAQMQAQRALVNGIFSFAKAGLSFASTQAEMRARQQKIAEAEAKENAMIDGMLGGLGLGGENFMDTSVELDPETVASSDALETVQTAETVAITNATEDMATSENPITQQSAFAARQNTLAQQLAPVRGNVYAARAMFPSALQEAVNSGAIRPGAQGIADAQRFTRDFVKAAGLGSADRKLLAEVFAPTAMATIQNTIGSVTRQHNEAMQKANQVEVQSRISSLTDGANVGSIGSTFEQARFEAKNGNIGLTNDKAATVYTVGEMLTNLKAEGKTAEIEALRGHVYNPSTGRTLGQDFDHLFDKASYEAEGRNITLNNRERQAAAISQQEITDSFFSAETPEQKEQAIAALEALGTEKGYKAAQELRNIGANYDPSVARGLQQQMQSDGKLPTKAQIDGLYREGTINQKEYNYWSKKTTDAIVDTTLKPVIQSLKKDIRSTMIQNAGGKTDAFSGQLATRVDQAVDAVVESLSLEVANNPDLAADPSAIRQRALDTVSSVLARPEFQAEYDAATNSLQFKNPLASRAIPRVGPGKEDYTSLRADQVFSPSTGIPRSSIQAQKDIIVPIKQLQSDTKALLNGNTSGISNRTRLFAKNLNMSPKAFIDAQLKAHKGVGLAELQQMQQQSRPATPDPAPTPAAGNMGNPQISPSMNGKQRTVQMGRALLKSGYTMWQHPNFDIDGYHPEGTGTMGGHASNSAHYHNEALDFPLSHNSEAQLDRLYRYFQRNKERFGINELLWRTGGHHTHLHVSFFQ